MHREIPTAGFRAGEESRALCLEMVTRARQLKPCTGQPQKLRDGASCPRLGLSALIPPECVGNDGEMLLWTQGEQTDIEFLLSKDGNSYRHQLKTQMEEGMVAP